MPQQPTQYELAADIRMPPDLVRAGTFEGWQDAIRSAATAPNCPHFTLGAAAGFVGPILQLCDLDTCGLNLSGTSTVGKTLTQRLAVSPWCTPRLNRRALFKPAAVTENSVEYLARQSTGRILALDELAHIDGKLVGRLIYSLASGVGKARMQASMKPQPTLDWSTFMIFSCEHSLEHKVRAEGGRWSAGMAARIVDIDCNDVNHRVDRGTLNAVEAIFNHHGHAGRRFVDIFIEHDLHHQAERLRRQILDLADAFAGADVDGATRRAARPFALLQIAGTLAKQFAVLPAETDVEGAVAWGWAKFCGSGEAESLAPDRQALDNIRRWIAERWDASIKRIGSAYHSGRDAVGWYDDDAIYVPRAHLPEAADHVLGEQAIVKLLVTGDCLVERHSSKRAAVQYIKGVDRVTAYALKRDKFGPEAKA
jgi:hypothetical protein